jgi:hypothetical protein
MEGCVGIEGERGDHLAGIIGVEPKLGDLPGRDAVEQDRRTRQHPRDGALKHDPIGLPFTEPAASEPVHKDKGGPDHTECEQSDQGIPRLRLHVSVFAELLSPSNIPATAPGSW